MDWPDLIRIGVVALASFAGSLAAVRTDIAWIKNRLTANERAITRLHKRMDDCQMNAQRKRD